MISRLVTPGSTHDTGVLEVDLEHAVQAGERDDDAAGDRQRAAREPGAGAAGDERHAVGGAEPHHRLHLGGRAGQDDELGDRPVPGERIALVGA